MEYIILFYDTSTTPRSLDLEGIDIARLPDVRFPILINSGFACDDTAPGKHLKPPQFNVGSSITPHLNIDANFYA